MDMKTKIIKTSKEDTVYHSFEQWEKENFPNKVNLDELTFKSNPEKEIEGIKVNMLNHIN